MLVKLFIIVRWIDLYALEEPLSVLVKIGNYKLKKSHIFLGYHLDRLLEGGVLQYLGMLRLVKKFLHDLDDFQGHVSPMNKGLPSWLGIEKGKNIGNESVMRHEGGSGMVAPMVSCCEGF